MSDAREQAGARAYIRYMDAVDAVGAADPDLAHRVSDEINAGSGDDAIEELFTRGGSGLVAADEAEQIVTNEQARLGE